MSDGGAVMTSKSIAKGQDIRFDASGCTALQLIVQVKGEPGVRVIPLDKPSPVDCTALFLVVSFEGDVRPRILEINPPERRVTFNEFTYTVPAGGR